jgi:ATP-dependent Clp protease ATP-binding subunit ClpC
LNRIDDVVIFNSLTKENIFSIIDILMKGVTKRLTNLGFTLELTEDAKSFLADKGYDQASLAQDRYIVRYKNTLKIRLRRKY